MKKSVVRAGGPKPFQTGKTFEEDSRVIHNQVSHGRRKPCFCCHFFVWISLLSKTISPRSHEEHEAEDERRIGQKTLCILPLEIHHTIFATLRLCVRHFLPGKTHAKRRENLVPFFHDRVFPCIDRRETQFSYIVFYACRDRIIHNKRRGRPSFHFLPVGVVFLQNMSHAKPPRRKESKIHRFFITFLAFCFSSCSS
jgi:hypothetical protein